MAYWFVPADFSVNANGHEYPVTKPSCGVGGIPVLDTGPIVTEVCRWTTRGNCCQFNDGYLAQDQGGCHWMIRFPADFGKVRMTARVYCSYPIQCIKQ